MVGERRGGVLGGSEREREGGRERVERMAATVLHEKVNQCEGC